MRRYQQVFHFAGVGLAAVSPERRQAKALVSVPVT
jgi:hypothetical protein